VKAQRFCDDATNPLVDPRVAAAMRCRLGEPFGNPASLRTIGRQARAAMESAKGPVRVSLGRTKTRGELERFLDDLSRDVGTLCPLTSHAPINQIGHLATRV